MSGCDLCQSPVAVPVTANLSEPSMTRNSPRWHTYHRFATTVLHYTGSIFPFSLCNKIFHKAFFLYYLSQIHSTYFILLSFKLKLLKRLSSDGHGECFWYLFLLFLRLNSTCFCFFPLFKLSPFRVIAMESYAYFFWVFQNMPFYRNAEYIYWVHYLQILWILPSKLSLLCLPFHLSSINKD